MWIICLLLYRHFDNHEFYNNEINNIHMWVENDGQLKNIMTTLHSRNISCKGSNMRVKAPHFNSTVHYSQYNFQIVCTYTSYKLLTKRECALTSVIIWNTHLHLVFDEDKCWHCCYVIIRCYILTFIYINFEENNIWKLCSKLLSIQFLFSNTSYKLSPCNINCT